ncbi:hypothetical protein L2E82_35950 [Cichorium intybus]|uniref:Uncharacterized protein n=1 Tax=Cichorium intybus TaxID=13427 RepID=A0ACB9BQB3_CICIN|nr:hypothetical protein L2E82_35950 [Cichorium intybus]
MDVSGISFLPHIVLRYLYMLDSLTVYMVRKGRDSTSFLILCSFLPKIKDLLQEKEISRRSKVGYFCASDPLFTFLGFSPAK